MEIKEFVKQVLNEVGQAIQESRSSTARGMGIYSGNGKGIDFDIAVVATDSGSKSVEGGGKVGIHVLGLNADGKMEAASSTQQSSRIRFTIYGTFG